MSFPTDDAVKESVYLALMEATKKWTQPIHNWGLILNSILGISRNTVNTYMQLFAASGALKELLDFENSDLAELFSSHTTVDTQRHNELMLYFEGVNKARDHPGFTFLYHYQQYVEQAQEPYSYTQFLEHYRRKYPKEQGSMKLDHVAGEELFIDFAGKKLHITDRETGKLVPVEVFVAILPCSQYTYVQACMSQKRGDLIWCCTEALRFYGGAPKAIISDNLKSAVNRASKYEADINRSFKDFARHYNCVINPTRGYSPQDKALVENAVHLVYQRIYYPLREMTFFSLEDLNKEIGILLKSYNNLLFKHKESSRVELFQSIERQYLKELPALPYDINYSAERNLDKNMFARLATLDFVSRKENVIICGASGTGKSYLSQALGHQGCLSGIKTLYAITARLFKKLKLSKVDGTYLKELEKLTKMELLILDDFGLQAFDNQDRETLMDIIDDRHGKKSTMISSQIPVSAWYEIIGGEGTIADAILDRIVNSSHRIDLKGESLRKGILKQE